MQMSNTIHYLHIGKIGGRYLKHIFKQVSEKEKSLEIISYNHQTTIRNVVNRNTEAKIIFSVRDPQTRFVSGFYSRQRKGQHDLLSEWSPGERAAFTCFNCPIDLAEALSDNDL